MSLSVTAIYPGTFDPLTLGHEDIVRRASRLFSKVIVAVAIAHHKKTLFDVQERVSLVQTSLKDCSNVSVIAFDGLVKDCAISNGAQVMVRGVRGVTDFDFEAQLCGMNKLLAPSLETVFLTPQAHLQCLSSTLIREISSLKGDVSAWVSESVHQALLKKHSSH
jgi:pantetheine-phosphate adenylyltransferase